MLHISVQENPKVKNAEDQNQYELKTLRDGQTGIEKQIHWFKFDAQFYLRTSNNFENKLFLSLSATIPTFDNSIFLKNL